MRMVSLQLVHSPVFHEIRRFHSCIIDCVFTRVGSALHQCLRRCHAKEVWQLGEQLWSSQLTSQTEGKDRDVGNQQIDESVSLAAASLRSKRARQKLQEKLTLRWSKLARDVLESGIDYCMKHTVKGSHGEGNRRSPSSQAIVHISEQLEVTVDFPQCRIL